MLSEDGKQLGLFDSVVVAVPAPQAEGLLTEVPPLKEKALSAKIAPCWAVMLGLKEKTDIPFGGAFVNDETSPLSWVCKDSSKPGRPQGMYWLKKNKKKK